MSDDDFEALDLAHEKIALLESKLAAAQGNHCACILGEDDVIITWCGEHAALRQERDELRLKWQTGKPPKDGWYWRKAIKSPDSLAGIQYFSSFEIDSYQQYWSYVTWAGPLEPPKEGE